MAAQDTQKPGLNGESDEDLLIHMSLGGSEPAAAKKAWDVFYDRYIRYVHGHSWEALDKRLHGRYDGKAIWDMAAQQRASERKKNFTTRRDVSLP